MVSVHIPVHERSIQWGEMGPGIWGTLTSHVKKRDDMEIVDIVSFVSHL